MQRRVVSRLDWPSLAVKAYLGYVPLAEEGYSSILVDNFRVAESGRHGSVTKVIVKQIRSTLVVVMSLVVPKEGKQSDRYRPSDRVPSSLAVTGGASVKLCKGSLWDAYNEWCPIGGSVLFLTALGWSCVCMGNWRMTDSS